jgi:hypothetical protein
MTLQPPSRVLKGNWDLQQWLLVNGHGQIALHPFLHAHQIPNFQTNCDTRVKIWIKCLYITIYGLVPRENTCVDQIPISTTCTDNLQTSCFSMLFIPRTKQVPVEKWYLQRSYTTKHSFNGHQIHLRVTNFLSRNGYWSPEVFKLMSIPNYWVMDTYYTIQKWSCLQYNHSLLKSRTRLTFQVKSN